ncbi:MAG: Ni/Fe hydrogenase subunit gamma [Candidatus Nitronauta litoralis]|uniref:Ni/Fe hydrogenase subunit gamma n=1 Tax=Candidatus Nitronauta litoralis TaxID=2705533 RepID=A0A7T0BVA6_9BACT|nr:MAG: Ni/Fe hydrogenase subunit gamma [Candidatus Nitronauta litoralis]
MNPINSDPVVPELLKIHRVIREAEDTFTLDLLPPDKTQSEYSPGQFNMLYAFGVGDVPISISGRSSQSGGWLHTIREVGTVTRALHRLKKGQTIGVRGPFGKGWPVDLAKGKDVVILAGGIGLAPLRPVLEQIQSHRDHYGNVSLLYGARMPDGLLFSQDRETWRGRNGIQVKVTVDTGDRDWRGNVGVVTHLIDRVKFDSLQTIAMVCGPEVMMRYSVRELQRFGVPTNQIFISMERNMKCAVGFCGHCQFGPSFICKDGPVFDYPSIQPFLEVREL